MPPVTFSVELVETGTAKTRSAKCSPKTKFAALSGVAEVELEGPSVDGTIGAMMEMGFCAQYYFNRH